ncbi:M20/M25/M40 family metallo-hydrolase [Anaeroselena agilis]|uniref:M20/M25/M40 family metallo-hydrolase n=1 Tax=Anaeroselena agilis TaxID=3063788 RepID=A0ABU3P1X2_9FIRM|nr:M20/M25/M40 family metallo-hydrolase [Selenomonadales bacterium 4137-cl]
MVDKQRMLAEFFELVSIKCSTRDEREVADVVKAKLAALGCAVDEDDVGGRIGGNCGNVIAYLKGNVATAPVVMLSAHLDCVEPCAGIKPQLKDGVITSGGDTILGADDKSGVAGILEALSVVRETGAAHGDIQVVFTVAEEGGVNGSKNMDRGRLKADYGYVLDSGGAPGRIINAAPGQNSIKVVVRGKTAHAGVAPEEGVNAIVVAGKAMAELRQGRIDDETTANVGIIKGGQATNIVPDYVEIACEARSRNREKLAAQTKHMVDTFEQVAAANGAKAEVTVKTAYAPYVLTADMPVAALARQAAESIGLTPVFEATGGGSDANFFNAYGVPSAVLGTGMSKVHTTAEFIKEDDLYKTAELVVAIIKEAAKTPKP